MTKVNNHKEFLTGEICSTTGVTIKEEIAKEYSQEIIDLAIQLKANNLEGAGGERDTTKYTAKPLKGELDAYDTTFVTLAKNIIYRDFCSKFDAIYKKVAMNCDISDSEWAIYSAEEILEMEQNGTVIPKEVVEWAHSQQQLDATNDTLSTISDSEDATVADNLSDTDALAVLQATAKKNIEKVEKAAEKIDEKQDKYDEISAKAAQVKNKKEDDFNKKVEEVENLKKEWETLNSKKENGGLSFVEKLKYHSLSKQLQNSDSTFSREMNFGNSELDEFLDELGVINNEISTNTQVAKDAIDAGKALNDLDKDYNVETLPYAYTGTTLDNSGLISDELSGLTNEDIGEQAIKKGGELESDTNTLEEDVNSADNVETEDFAVNYTGYVQESKDETENVKKEANVDEAENTTETETSQEAKEEKTQTQNSETKQEEERKLEYGSKSAIKATVTTLLSSGIDITQGIGVTKDDKALNKELKTTSKAMDRINKEVEKVTEKLTDNETDTERFIQELEQLQAENPEDGDVQISANSGSKEAVSQDNAAGQNSANTTAAQNSQQAAGGEGASEGIIVKDENSEFAKAVEKSNTIIGAFDAADEIVANEKEKQAEENQGENPEETAKKAENRAKKVEVAEKIQGLGSEKEVIANDLQAANEKGDAATKKGIKLLGTLNKSNAKLNNQNDKTAQDASDAVDIGVGTYEQGAGHTLEGMGLLAYGASLMSNPFTFNTGVIISALGQKIYTKGQKEIVTGLISTAAGMTSKGVVSEENSVISDSIDTMTKAQPILNVNVLNLTQSENQAQDAEKNTNATAETQSLQTSETAGAETDAAGTAEAAETEAANTEAATAETAQAPQESLTGFAAPVEEIPVQDTKSEPVNQQNAVRSEAPAANNNDKSAQTDTQTAPLIRAAETTGISNTAKVTEPNDKNNTVSKEETAEEAKAAAIKENNITSAENNKTGKTTETNPEATAAKVAEETAETTEDKANIAEKSTDEIKKESEKTAAKETSTESSGKVSVQEEGQIGKTTEDKADIAEKSTDEIKKESEKTAAKETSTESSGKVSAQEEGQTGETTEAQNSKKSKSEKEDEELDEKDAASATKDANKNAQNLKEAQTEDAQNNKEFNKTSQQVNKINKSAKNDEKKFKKQMQTEQKQIEKKQQEIEQTNTEITEKEAALAETQTNQEALIAALSNGATPSKQAELQPQIQTNAVTLTDKSAEIAALKENVSTVTILNTKKVQHLRKTAKTFVSTMKAKSKTSQKAETTADKILKTADTISQIAGIASMVGSITSRIGNAMVTAGNTVIIANTPLLSNPITAGGAAAAIATATATQVVPGTTTSIVGESVSLAANITNAAASATKAVIYAEQGNIAGAIMATGSAIMSGVSAGQNISQIGQLNQMADSANSVTAAAQSAADSTKAAGDAATVGVTDEAAKQEILKGVDNSAEVNKIMSPAMDGTKDAAGKAASDALSKTDALKEGQKTAQKTTTKGFNELSKNFKKFGIDDVMQIGGALQTAGSMVASKNDGKTEVTKKKRMQRFGQIARLNTKRKTRRVNAASASANSGSSSGNTSRQ